MDELRFRPMTTEEFEAISARMNAEYAAEHVAAGDWTQEEALARAAEESAALLPQGLATPGMVLLVAEKADGEVVGRVWVAMHRPGNAQGGWIYDIEVEPGHRGKGFGRALLEAAEREVARHGVTTIGLNVFGGNDVARHLYESSGYCISALQMQKKIIDAE